MASTARTRVIDVARPRANTVAMAVAFTIATGLGLLPATASRADTLLIENVAGSRPAGAEHPRRGSSMANVEHRFGAPTRRSGPVGQPPISRWDYQGFVVFFEYDHVIHSVRR